MERLEAAVARLEALSAGSQPSIDADEQRPVDPAVKAFDELRERSLGRLSAVGEKIGGKVLEATKILEEAFSVQRDLLVKVKQSKVGVRWL